MNKKQINFIAFFFNVFINSKITLSRLNKIILETGNEVLADIHASKYDITVKVLMSIH